ncbi:hypothetical protein I4U23_015579 [Adineta vaga]|nr:hypothetical protein I4U23_015579 [Adineta vaga]
MALDNMVDIREQCTFLLSATRNSTVKEQLPLFLDNVLKCLKKIPSIWAKPDVIVEITKALLAVDRVPWFLQPQVLQHQLFIILRDYLVEVLFDDKQAEMVTNLSALFHKICENDPIKDEMISLMLYKPLIDKMNVFITEFDQKHGTTKQIECMCILLHIFKRIQMIHINLYQHPLLEILFLTVSKLINSKFLIAQLFNTRNLMMNLDPIQTFLFDTCIEFMYWQPYEESLLRRQNLKQICETHISTIVRMMSSLSFSEPVIRMASLLSIYIMVQENDNDEKILHQDYYDLLKYCVAMLDNGKIHSKERLLLECICHLSNHPDLLILLKENESLKTLLLTLSEVDDSGISFSSYRILALIMCEDDIKTLKNANKIVGVFYLYLISMLDDPVQRTAFLNLLYSLKSLIQHDQVKVEIVQQDMISPLIQCVTVKQKFHSIKIQQYAIEILIALSFNDDAMHILEQDHDLIECLTTLKSSDEELVQRAATHLIWRFEQKRRVSHPKVFQSISKSKFDIMISYSHSDKQLCFQVCDFLERSGFRVWLDRDRMHGDAIVAMADAIESSEFIIICMSETYKLSPYCQAEANYAFQRQCKLVPLIMKSKYKPDGWLGFITSGKIYVDFAKHEFTVACSMLTKEIESKRELTTHREKSPIIVHESITTSTSPMKINQQHIRIDLPHSVDKWSTDHVQSFLIKNELTSFSTILTNFNGDFLHQTYLMCEKSRESMFQAMRQEVSANGNSSILTLGTYYASFKN